MTQLLPQPLTESSNLINGFRRVRDIAPAAPPCPGGARARQGGCSWHRQGNGRVARQMCTHKGQMRSRSSRVCHNLHVGSGTWSLPEQGNSGSFPSCRASATCLPCPRESREEQGRPAPPDACSAFCLTRTSGNTWTQEQGKSKQVGRSHLFSP